MLLHDAVLADAPLVIAASPATASASDRGSSIQLKNLTQQNAQALQGAVAVDFQRVRRALTSGCCQRSGGGASAAEPIPKPPDRRYSRADEPERREEAIFT